MHEKSLVKKVVHSVIAGHKSFCKFLSANDTGKTGGHQAGIYVPKSALTILFDSPCERGKNFARRAKLKWQDEVITECRFIYYGAKTRNKYRITNCGTNNYNPLEEENTGALVVIVQENFEEYAGWILNTEDDIEYFLDAFGISPTETGRLITLYAVSPEVRLNFEMMNFISTLDVDFPQGEIMSQAARRINEQVFNHSEYIKERPDQKLIQWIDTEYKLFRALEEARYGEKIRRGFADMKEFLDIANSILNRRKSRAGKSLEYHLAAIFDGNNLYYDSQIVTEGNKRPDFIFPRGAYHNLSYNADKLIVLAAKTTCKDRWRQILNEADRVRGKNKYLCTLQQGISLQQLREMQSEHVVLVVPKPYIEKYPKEFRDHILTLSTFIAFVQNLQ